MESCSYSVLAELGSDAQRPSDHKARQNEAAIIEGLRHVDPLVRTGGGGPKYHCRVSRTDDELRERRDDLQKRDLAQRAQLATYGVDPSARRRSDLTFWAPDENAAKRLADAMTKNEMSPPLVLGPNADGSGDRRWLLRTALAASVDFITATENVVTFLLFADGYGCDYDGWGTAVTEAAERD